MRLRLLTTTPDLAQVFEAWCAKADNIRIVTAWANTGCLAYPVLTAARNTISTLVVGLDFYTTSPSFLESLRSSVRIGKAPGSATFHPKVYLFTHGHAYCCIMGSSNFTGGGFGDNIELNVCITGKDSEAFFSRVTAFIDAQEQQSDEISSPEIADYRRQFDKLATARTRLAKFRLSGKAKIKARAKNSKQARGQEPPEQLNKTWGEYVKLILAQENRPELVIQGSKDDPGYLETAEYCQALFRQHARLNRMSFADRQFVGGTIRGAGWFGSMRGNGFFMQRLNENSQSLDGALDNIPLTGLVNSGMFDAFVAHYQWEGSGVGTASRLLAMKRPDLFLCMESKNRAEVASAFNVTGSSLQTFDGYWALVLRIWKCPWWRTPQPHRTLERRIWNARVALLDSVYYYFEK